MEVCEVPCPCHLELAADELAPGGLAVLLVTLLALALAAAKER